ncbi:MAG: DNA polymerase III subunit gamma/tau [Gemmatimonadaceae bacterium]|nr:DNA polymerase III subunit gamma/tau [Gemmatimonadaceae bacterium]
MPFQVTARKWRPQRFSEVVGQEHITATLTNALASGRIAHCYLFCGPRGVGKTTTARILAKALNCSARGEETDPCGECPSCTAITDGTSMDVLEIDGASNNSVDDVRELREVVRYIPTGGAHKIYIIDEVHMLSRPAFNALLKTLEEPPERVVFVFATTEVQEVPETILSRCQRFNFRRISTSSIAGHLGEITAAEKIESDQEALYLLAHRADGALRDAESLLDQVVSFGGCVSGEGVREVLGLIDRGVFFEATSAIAEGDGGRLLDLVTRVLEEGGDLEEFVGGLVEHASRLLFTKVQESAARLEVTEDDARRYEEAADALTEADLLRIVQTLMELEAEVRKSLQPRFRTELALVRLAGMGRAVDVGRLLARLSALEAAVAGGGAAAAPPSRRSPPRSRTPDSGPPLQVPPPAAEEEAPGPAPDHEGSGPSGSPSEAAGPSPEGDLDIQQLWPRVVDLLRETQPSMPGFLQEVTRLEMKGSVLTLFFDGSNRFVMGQVVKAEAAVAAAVARAGGPEVRVLCSVDRGEAPAPAENPGSAAPPPARTSPEAGLDPKVRSVLEALDGEIV